MLSICQISYRNLTPQHKIKTYIKGGDKEPMSDEYDFQDVIPGKKKKSKHDLLSQLRDMEEESYTTSSGYTASSFLPSSMLKEQKPKKEKKSSNDFEYDADAWFEDMLAYQIGGDSRKKKIRNDLFDSAGITCKKKKKKKKKGKDGELIDYKKEFEPEAALYKNLLMEQTRFTESLQKEYDSIKSVKSSSRGVTKQMTDLIDNITSARSLAMQLVDKQVSIKKQAAELNMKQRKELGASLGDTENMADFASTYLKQMFNDRQALFNNGSGDSSVSEYTEDELFEELSASLTDETNERPDEVELYLKYENSNVQVYVVITDDDVENYEFLAKDQDGNVIPDYPMPNHTSISINRSTGIATDTYGKKYNIIWQ